MTFRLAATLCFLTIFWVSSVASAQDAETITKVEKHFESGANLFQSGQYEQAIEEFEAGYALYPDPILLYNISLAHGKLGRVDKSLTVAELAESMNLQEPDRTQNQSRIVALRRAQVSQDMAPIIAQRVKAEERERAEAEAQKRRRQDEFGTYGWIGVGVAGAGVLALVGAIILDASLSSDIDAFEDAAARGDQLEYDRLKSDIESKQSTSQILLFTGIGLTAVGAGFIVYELFFDGRSDSAVSIAPTQGGAAASYRLRF